LKIGFTSVVIPSRDRPERLLKAVESVLGTAPDVEVILVLYTRDVESRAIVSGLVPDENIVLYPSTHLHTAELWNLGAAVASGEYLVTGADDLIFKPGWHEAARTAMDKMGGYGLVSLNLGLEFGFEVSATHYMVSRKYAVRRLGGCLMIPVYEHGFTDIEVSHRAFGDRRLVYEKDAVAEHLHPSAGTVEMDHIYEKGSSSNDRDEALYWERREAGFPDDFEPVLEYDEPPGWGTVAVAVRSYKFPEPDFIESWNPFLMTGLDNGDRVLRWARNAPNHVAANQLAGTFLANTACDSILFIDDDMTFEPDALRILRNSADNFDCDIVSGFFTFKTEPPHAVVYILSEEQPEMPEALGGEVYKAMSNVPDNSVIPVDAVGMAFTLIKRHVFEKLTQEHGPLWTVWFDWGKHSEGEDIRFSRRVREAGFTMAVDSNVKIRHVGRRSYGWEEHQQFVEQLENSHG